MKFRFPIQINDLCFEEQDNYVICTLKGELIFKISYGSFNDFVYHILSKIGYSYENYFFYSTTSRVSLVLDRSTLYSVDSYLFSSTLLSHLPLSDLSRAVNNIIYLNTSSYEFKKHLFLAVGAL